MVQPRTGESDRAKQRAEDARVVLFDPERLPTGVTPGMGRDKGRGLLFHKALLKRGEDLLRFGEGQTEVLNTLAGLLQDHHIDEGFFVAIVVAHHELDFELHGSCPPV